MYGYGYGMGYGYGFDWTYLLVIIGLLLSMAASAKVKTTYNKYASVRSRRGITAAQAAQQILHDAGIYDVQIQHISGNLTDNYNPTDKVLRLSDATYSSTSVAAIGVAAHECGHAIQHQVGYAPLKLRSASVPIANIGSQLSFPIIFLGLLLGYTGLAQIGVVLFLFVVLFQLITLPVEFDASHRALKILDESSMLMGEEMDGAKKVLKAAALTYVAALFSSILQLLRLIMLTQRGQRRR